MVRKARIKGTEFEINGKIDSPLSTNAHGKYEYVYWGDGFGAFIPKEWVEFYDPPREEPGHLAVEIDKHGLAWQRLRNGGFGFWYRAFNVVDSSAAEPQDGTPGNGITWKRLQQVHGPTKPMAQVPEVLP